MKKLLIVLALSTLMLSGCGIFRSTKAWDKAKQESPLEIPPSMDRPSTDAALVIPPKVQPRSEIASAAPAPAQVQNPTSMHMSGDVDAVWRRVGQALSQGDLGTVSAQDQASHSYELQVSGKPTIQQGQSFLQKHFSNTPDQGAPAQAAAGNSAAATTTLTIRVTPASDGGSVVTAQGDPTQAARIVNALQGRLGG